MLITLTDIVKKYHIADTETTILNQVSLQVPSGEMLAIVGASGSGKSTLMNIIGLLDKPDKGEYYWRKRCIQHLDADELATLRNYHLGFVFQQFNLLPRFTVAQNVSLPLTYRNWSKTIVEKKVHEALMRVGMQAYASRYPSQLSGGQQQRIAIARALVGEPELILADEPTGSLDSHTSKEIMDLFLSLHKEGRTMLIVTHDEKVAHLCRQCIRMTDGRIT